MKYGSKVWGMEFPTYRFEDHSEICLQVCGTSDAVSPFFVFEKCKKYYYFLYLDCQELVWREFKQISSTF